LSTKAESLKKILLIDDKRNIKATVTARNFFEGIGHLVYNGPWDLLLLDHDLASYDSTGRERTGYHIMCFLEIHPEYLPRRIQCVSDNGPGIKNIRQVIEKLIREGELQR